MKPLVIIQAFLGKQQYGPEDLNKTQLSMKFLLLINVKMPKMVGISTFMSRKNSILDLFEPEKC